VAEGILRQSRERHAAGASSWSMYNGPFCLTIPFAQEFPMSRLFSFIAVFFFLAGLPAHAVENKTAASKAVVAVKEDKQEATIRAAVEKALNVKVDNIRKSGYLGLYEIFAKGQILYVDEKVNIILVGELLDIQAGKNITEERLGKLTAVQIADLPFAQAIKQVRGKGKRVLVSFEDPNCGYCKRLATELQKLDNATIYVFMVPMLSADSDRKSRQIWCATDRVKAWNDWMVNAKEPAGNADCDTSAIDRNITLGQRLNVNGTPTLFFANGERVPGMVPLQKIEEKLNQQAK
jgi:thiol:disulfide interchange protein DsbC